jgi:hypothetical protein
MQPDDGARDPIGPWRTDVEVQASYDRFEGPLGWSMETSGGRVLRYATYGRAGAADSPPQSVAAPRGDDAERGRPQTPGELRINSDRLHIFGAILCSCSAFLEELRPSAGPAAG